MKLINTLFLLSVALSSAVAEDPDYPECNICGPGGTITNPNQQVTFKDVNTACFELQGEGAGSISPEECATLPELVGEPCGCTFSPTQAPTASGPEYPPCNICGTGQPMNSNAQVTDAALGINTACFELQGEGTGGSISSDTCAQLPALVSSTCDCQPGPNPVCNICPEGEEPTNLDGSLTNPSTGETKSCGDWKLDGSAGAIPANECSRLEAADSSQSNRGDACQCMRPLTSTEEETSDSLEKSLLGSTGTIALALLALLI